MQPTRSCIAYALHGKCYLRSPFEHKERDAIELLGVSTVNDFLEIDLQRVFGLRGFGATTYAKLKKNRDTLRAMLFPSRPDGNGTGDVQCDDDDIAALGLSARGLKALRRLKVHTIRNFLFLDLEAVGPLHNCGAVTRSFGQALRDAARSSSTCNHQCFVPDHSNSGPIPVLIAGVNRKDSRPL